MNFIFISPNFPKTYFNFCKRLKDKGVNVLGIGDEAYDSLSYNLKESLTEYYYVSDMKNYSEMFKAVAYFSYKYGKIDFIESNNEYWLETDAKLRTDFNVTTGPNSDLIPYFKSKALMKEKYKEGNIPCPLCHKVISIKDTKKFIKAVGYPVILKPENGVGAANTYKVNFEKELIEAFSTMPNVNYVCEQFITGNIYSYDAIVDSNSNPIFESCAVFPPSIADIVNNDLDLDYYVLKKMPSKLKVLGRKTLKAFSVKSRFVHFEFFRLTKDIEGLGKIKDFVALEVNMRPAGGYTPDMMNFAHSTDVYEIWSEMIVNDKRVMPKYPQEFFCAYKGRKDNHNYYHSDSEIRTQYKSNIVMDERMPKSIRDDMGDQMFTLKLDKLSDVKKFFKYTKRK